MNLSYPQFDFPAPFPGSAGKAILGIWSIPRADFPALTKRLMGHIGFFLRWLMERIGPEKQKTAPWGAVMRLPAGLPGFGACGRFRVDYLKVSHWPLGHIRGPGFQVFTRAFNLLNIAMSFWAAALLPHFQLA